MYYQKTKKQPILRSLPLKCRIQNVAFVTSFLCGVLLTSLVFMKYDECEHIDKFGENIISGRSNKQIKSGAFDLIILIISSPSNGDRRQTIRETWLQFENNQLQQDDTESDHYFNDFRMKYYFVIGSLNLNVDTILHLSTEQSVNNDLMFLNIKDDYQSLSSKVLNSFVWLDNQLLNENFDYNLVMKIDDDTFVRLDLLAKDLIEMRNVENLYWGYFKGNGEIKTTGKWKEENWFYCDRYLPYALGGGYLLSKSLVTFIARNSHYFKLLKCEDVSVGFWLTPVRGINRKHDVRFDTEWISRGCQNDFLVMHKQSMESMRQLYKNIQSTGQLCRKEYLIRPNYEYNWDVRPSQCCV